MTGQKTGLTLPLPLKFPAAWLAAWLGRVLQEQVDCLKAENRLLREKVGTKRMRLTDAERRRLAILGKALGRKGVAAVATIATPEAILRWCRECLERMVPLGEGHLQRSISEYMAHYHHERKHQGLGNALIDGNLQDATGTGAVARRERLGGMLNFYYREAA